MEIVSPQLPHLKKFGKKYRRYSNFVEAKKVWYPHFFFVGKGS